MKPDTDEIEIAPREKLDHLIRKLRPRRAAVGIARRPAGQDRCPASFAQRRMWLADRMAPGSAAYNLPGALRLVGRLEVAALEAALGEVVRRHQALRTTFSTDDGELVQVIHPAPSRYLPRVDLSRLEAPRRDGERDRLCRAEARRGFDLERGPLLRTVLLGLDAEEHELLVALHHAVADGWSLAIFVRELATLYRAAAAGQPSPLPESPLQYADYSLWQHQQQGGDRSAGGLAYWRRQLDGLEPLELPADKPRSMDRSFEGHRRPVVVVGELTRGLRALAGTEGATLYGALLALFAAFLGRHAGRRDLAVGAPVAGRRRRRIEGLIGCFVNTLVLRCDLSGEPSLRRLLGRARDTLLAADAHQEVPFERLVEALEPERDPSATPLVQVLLSLEPPLTPLAPPGLRMIPEKLSTGTAKVDLTLVLEESESGLWGAFEARRDLFEATSVERMARRFTQLAAAALAAPDVPLDELGLLEPTERHQLLFEWAEPVLGIRAGESVPARWAAQVTRRPEAPALVAGDLTLSYRRLDTLAGRLAAHLRVLGVERETVVAVVCERSAEMVVAALAAWKVGAAYLPIDPIQPDERLRYLIEDSGARVALSHGRHLRRLPAASVLDLGDAASYALEPVPAVAIEPEALAYVIYTSGSTGRPKGTELRHRGLAALVAWHLASYRVGAGDRASQLASPGFDAAVWELWPYLSAGASVHLPPAETAASPPRLLAWLAASRITCSFLPTPLLEACLDEPLPADLGLRHLLTGGDRLRRSPARPTPFGLINHYGPTEATVVATCEPVAAGGGAPPIGRPISGLRAYVVDRRGRPVAIGLIGELRLGGESLARGYRRRPALTAESFVPDELGGAAGARLYRTGDRVRHLPDGRLLFLGRRDQQVKVRGFRIELGEVEATLAACDGVGEAVALVRPDATGELHLVAFLETAGGSPVPGVVRARAESRLPAYMVPSALAVVDRLPRLASGKVDRRELARRELPAASWGHGGGGEGSLGGTAPRTPLEELVAAIFSQVLELEEVGAETSFFELGGHSLRAAKVVARLREALGVELPLRSLFEAPTARALARRVEAARGEGRPVLPGIEVAPRDRALPPSFAQERLWLLDQLEPGDLAYSVPLAVRLRGRLDAARLEAALSSVVARHEVLRTTFPSIDDRPVQQVHTAGRIVLEPRAVGSEELEEHLEAEVSRPFDLARGGLVRAHLYRLEAEHHVLFLNLHHAVTDGWSLGVLVRELAGFYRGEELPPLAVQYADYAVWQRRWLAGEVLEGQLAYWRRQLAGLPSLELPLDRPRRPGSARPAASLPVRLESAALEALARAEGATPFMALLAVFSGLLGRLSDQRDLALGSPVAGRERLELEDLIGFFVNTLVLRAELSGDPDLRGLLARARETTLGAYAHQAVPFEKLVEELAPERDLETSPLFQVMLAFQNTPLGEVELDELSLEPLEVATGRAKFDLTLTLEEAEPGLLAGRLEYRSDLLDGPSARRLVGRLERLVAELPSRADLPLSTWPLLTPGEAQQALVEWNDTRARHGEAGLSLDALVLAQARRTPERRALASAGGALSFGALVVRAERLAARLRALGVGADARVGVCLERSPELVVALLGVLRSAAAYVPLDPEYPRERLAMIAEDAALTVLVTRGRLRERLGELACPVLDLDTVDLDKVDLETADLGAGAPGPPARRCHPGQLAYVLFTSGSTGRPKGVAISHGAIVGHMLWMRSALPLSAGDRVLQRTSASFDASVWEFWAPLIEGAGLVVPPAGAGRDPAELAALVGGGKGNVLQVVPSLLQALLAESSFAGCGSLRRLYCGGEALSTPLLERFLAALPGTELVNAYGPTEGAIHASFERRREVDDRAGVAIGRPIANARLYVLDRAFRPAAPGAAGELHLASRGLARGYLGRPGLTAERFVPDPFAAGLATAGAPGGRLYRTGDRVRQLADGRLEFLGRLDHQVKVRGFRIELGEIESVLSRLEGVSRVAVLARRAPAGDLRLVAYVETGAEGRAAGLREALGALLPAHMVPQRFERLERLPLTASGKIDRKALPEPDWQGEAAAPTAPRTRSEEVVAGIFCEVLGRASVGVTEDFFGLGGHSLLATRVVARLRHAFGVELPLRRFFEAPTVAGLAAAADAERAAALPPIEPVARDQDLPLSFAQERLWFLDQLETGDLAYSAPVAVRLEGRLERARLEAALNAVVARHEALRTAFPSLDGRPVQAIRPELALDLEPEELAPARLGTRLATEVARPFDLARGPLVRACLFRLAPECHVLLLNLHHAVTDGWSLGVLLRELGGLYRGEAPPPLAVQYADYAVWQRRWLAGAALEEPLGYWRRRLAGLPALELPLDRPRRSGGDKPAGSLSLRLETAALEALARHRGATPFMALLAVWSGLLGRIAGQVDLAVGSPVAGRERPELEALIGFFVNTLVLRADLRGDPDLLQLLERSRETTLGAYAHQSLPFEKLVEDLAPERSAETSPLFQVMLAYQNAPLDPIALEGLSLEPLETAAVRAKLELTLTVIEASGGRATAVLEYRRDLLDAATARRLGHRLERLLEELPSRPSLRLSSWPLLAAAERHQLLAEWSRGLPSPASRRSLPAALHEAALRRPEAIALDVPEAAGGAGQAWSYRRLLAEAGRMSRRLAAAGVGVGDAPEARVGLLAERSPEAVAALLGILEAGGAYVPLDPALPRERLAFLVADAGIRHLVVESRATAERTLGEAVLAGIEVLALEEAVGGMGEAFRPPPISAEQLAYVIYTSGSTGRPKGVGVSHGAALAHFEATVGALCLEPGDRFLQFASPSFDVALENLFAPLLAGATLVLGPGGAELEAQLLRRMARARVSVANLPTAFWSRLVEEAAGQPARAEVMALRLLLAGGEAMPAASLPGWRRAFPGCRLLNAYGPTEAVVTATLHEPGGGDVERVPVGRPLAGRKLLVLDRGGRPTVPGAVGEVCLGGLLARGYLGRPALTAERFVPDAFFAPSSRAFDEPRLVTRRSPRGAQLASLKQVRSVLDPPSHEPTRTAGAERSSTARRPVRLAANEVSGRRLYRTGDLGRWLMDGSLELLGRCDHQVKLRGFRIEPGEVEAALAAHPRIAAAAVMVVEVAGDRRLAAFVERASSAGDLAVEEVDGGSLREFLGSRLPAYMVPQHFALLESLPLTASGKVDRPALARRALVEGAGAGYEPPATAVEGLLAGFFAELLGARRAGRHDSFFELGGHSLLATRMVARIRRAFGVELPLSALFAAPTVAGLAREVEALKVERRGPEAPPLEPRQESGPAPLSFAQERLWFLDRLESGTSTYNVPAALRLVGSLDRPALAHALREVAKRHDVLRTTFTLTAGGPVQVVHPEPLGTLVEVDLTAAADREARMRAIVAREVGRPFDLEVGPLLRAALLRLGAHEHALVLVMHHVVSDGWSVGLLVREVVALYGAFAAGRPSPLPQLPLQYADYAVWQRRWLTGGVVEHELAYWRSRLGGELPVLDLPTDHRRPATRTFGGEVVSMRLGHELSESLRTLSRRLGATLFWTLLAGWKLLLHRLSGQDDLLVGTPVAGRDRLETEGLVGCFLNTLVLRTDLSVGPDGRAPSFVELLARVRATALEAYEHQQVSFERLLEELRPERDLSRTPLFQVFFNMLNLPQARAAVAELEIEALEMPEVGAKLDLTVYAADDSAGISLRWVYNEDLFRRDRIEEMLRQYLAILEQAVVDPERAIDTFSLMTEEARRLLPDPAAPLDPGYRGSVAELFALQAAASPERRAILEAGESWSYGELDRASGALAARLLASGLEKGERVVIYAHRSASLVVALLGTLRAGGAFVVLDPIYPPARQAEVLELSAPRAFVALEAAGGPPTELETVLDRLGSARLDLPSGKEALLSGSGEETRAPVPVGANDLAYVSFTSGSTGRPKGILGRHGSLTHFTPWQRETFALGADDRFSLLSGLAHDPLHRDVFTPLQLGASIAIPEPEAFTVSGRLASWLGESAVTVTHLTPAMGQLIAEVGELAPKIVSWRWAFFVGDVLSRRDVSRLRRLAPGLRVVNTYGSTETQRAVAWHPVTEAELREDSQLPEVLPLGRGIPDVQLLVLRPDGKPAGVGELGEVHVRSPHVALGYLPDPVLEGLSQTPKGASSLAGAPEHGAHLFEARRAQYRAQGAPAGEPSKKASSSSFFTNPHTGKPEDRVYRTGDLGRYLPDGEVVFAGRADAQVKLRGYRIELGEVEAALGRHPRVEEAVVALRETANGRALAAWVVPRDPGDAAAGGLRVEDLRAFVAERLPAYMVPSAWRVLDALPVTPTGKVDRRRLPAPEVVSSDAEAVPPSGELERRIAAAWREVLGLDDLSVVASFFDLGGHSLLLVRLHRRLEQDLGRALPLMDLFRHPSVRALAEYLGRDDAGTAGELAAARGQAQRQIEAARRGRRRNAGRRKTS